MLPIFTNDEDYKAFNISANSSANWRANINDGWYEKKETSSDVVVETTQRNWTATIVPTNTVDPLHDIARNSSRSWLSPGSVALSDSFKFFDGGALNIMKVPLKLNFTDPQVLPIGEEAKVEVRSELFASSKFTSTSLFTIDLSNIIKDAISFVSYRIGGHDYIKSVYTSAIGRLLAPKRGTYAVSAYWNQGHYSSPTSSDDSLSMSLEIRISGFAYSSYLELPPNSFREDNDSFVHVIFDENE